MKERVEITNASNNLAMWRLGEICSKAAKRKDVGDYIDRGLILIKALNKAGFKVTMDKRKYDQ